MSTRTPLAHPLCGHINSKKLLMCASRADVAQEDLQTAGYENFWCRHTQTDTGPDGGWVTLSRCAPGRGCYTPDEPDQA